MASNRDQHQPPLHHQYPAAWPPISGAAIQNNLIYLSDPTNTTNNNNNNPNIDYHLNPILPDTLYDDFSRLTLAGFPDPVSHVGPGSFLGNNNNTPRRDPSRGGGFYLGNNNNNSHLNQVLDFPAANMYLQRMRIESALLGFDGMDTYGYDNSYDSNTSYGYETNNNCNMSVNRVVPNYTTSSTPRGNRNGYHHQSNYKMYNNAFDIDRFEVDENRNNLMNFVRSSNVNNVNNVNNVTSAPPSGQYRSTSQQRQVAVLGNYGSLEDVRGMIYRLAKEQAGSKFLRDKFEGRKPEDIEIIFLEIKDHVKDLMADQFGNYLIQKFFDVCNEEQMNQILRSVISDTRSLLATCLDMHGTRAMQKLLENLTTQNQKNSVVSVLRNITLTLTKSMNGHHVIQQCLKLFTNEQIKPILDVVAENCLDIATDKSGCCVLQQCVAHAQGAPKRHLVDQITSNSLILSEHAYGNYVVQYILGLRVAQYTTDILRQLAGSFATLSMNKYGSNVVEKCLRESGEDQATQVINELVDSNDFLMVLQDPYGNYVAQSALSLAKDKQKLINAIQEHYAFIHSHPHGKRVLSRIKEFNKHH